jgi:hypothetical protein
LLIQIGTIAGSLIAVGTVVVIVTRHITRVEGRINELAIRIDHMHDELRRQDSVITNLNNYLLNNAASLFKAMERGDKNV